MIVLAMWEDTQFNFVKSLHKLLHISSNHLLPMLYNYKLL